MSAVEKARAAYIDAAKASEKAFHSLAVRSGELKELRAAYLDHKTAQRKRAYVNAKAIRAARYRSAKRAQAKKYRLRAKYVAVKAWESKPMRYRALSDALADVGVTESGGNNRGREVEAIIHGGGGQTGDAWCLWAVIKWYKAAGSIANWAVTYGGVVNIKIVDGVKRKLIPLAGYIIQYTFEHTGLFICFCDAQGKRRPRLFATHIKAVEANTGNSGAVSDSITGGDGVKVKIRPKALVAAYFKPTK